MDCEASAELIPRVALKFDVWGLKLIGFGVDVQSSFKLSLNGSMEMSNREQLKKDVKANVEIESSLGLFLYANFLNGNDLRAAISFPSLSYELDLLDKGKNHSIKKEVGEWSITGEFGDDVLMDVDKCGYALFRIGEEEPLEKQFIETVKTKSGSDVAVFSIPGNPLDYYIRSYNKVEDYDFFGPIIGNSISRIRQNIPIPGNFYTDYSFEYDEYCRLIKAMRSEPDNPDRIIYTYTYGDNEIHCGGSGYEIVIKTDSYGRVISYGNVSTFTYDGDNINIVSHDPYEGFPSTYTMNFIRTDGNTNTHIKTVTNEGGQTTTITKYTYLTQLDNYSIDFIHGLFDHYGVDEWGFGLENPPFLALPGFRNRNLLSSILYDGGYSLSIDYSYDDNNRVSQIRWPDYGGTVSADVSYIDL